jgi:hypothetical protein
VYPRFKEYIAFLRWRLVQAIFTYLGLGYFNLVIERDSDSVRRERGFAKMELAGAHVECSQRGYSPGRRR